MLLIEHVGDRVHVHLDTHIYHLSQYRQFRKEVKDLLGPLGWPTVWCIVPVANQWRYEEFGFVTQYRRIVERTPCSIMSLESSVYRDNQYIKRYYNANRRPSVSN